jgi:hypothetical protein
MSQGSAQSSNNNSSNKVPDWLFEVDEYDDVEEVVVDLDSGEVRFVALENIPILQELEIDLTLIYASIFWMLATPLTRLVGRPLGRHPLYKSVIASQRQNNHHHQHHNSSSSSSSKHRKEANIDFWGPCLVVGLYCLVLWLSKIHNTSWLFMIWAGASVFNHLVGRVYSKVRM